MTGNNKIAFAALLPGVVGIVPFATGAAAVLWPNHLITGHQVQWVCIAYGGLMLSFFSGVHWGVIIGPASVSRPVFAILFSAVPTLIALVAFLVVLPVALALLIASYLVLALCDVLAIEQRLLPEWLGLPRMIFTTGAVLSLLTMLVASLT